MPLAPSSAEGPIHLAPLLPPLEWATPSSGDRIRRDIMQKALLLNKKRLCGDA